MFPFPRRWKMLGLLILSWFQMIAQTPSSVANTQMWQANAEVKCLLNDGNKLYLGGNFTYLGPYTGRG